MTRPKNPSRYPVSSFGPELMELLLQGARKEIKLPCTSMKEMKTLQMRIHMLRSAMAREKHDGYAIATRAHCTCTWNFEKHPSTAQSQFPRDAEDCVLIIRPKDSQFGDILARAGITPSQGAQDLLDEVSTPSQPLSPIEPTPLPEATETPSDEAVTDPYARFKP